MKKILIIDNYDSFTYNLVHAVEEIVRHEITVKKNDQLSIEEVNEYDYLILSPGPGLPDEAGLLKEIISNYKASKNILGVCLGLQAIAEVYGGKLLNLETVYHGIQSEVQVIESSVLFNDLPEKILVGRYHSWVIDEASLPASLIVTTRDDKSMIMSIEDKVNPVYAVQFHPESIMTPQGKRMLENFLNLPL